MRSHEAGVLHAEGYGGPPLYLPMPADVMERLPQLWARTVTRDDEGRLMVGGVDVVTLAAEHGTAAYVLDEDDFRLGQPISATASPPHSRAWPARTSTTPERRSCARRSPDGCTRRASSSTSAPVVRLAVAQRAQFPGERIGFHGNNKTVGEIREALTYGVGRIVVDSFQEIDRIAEVAADFGVVAPVMVRVTVGVEAHTHEFIATGHEDQKFGFSLAGGQAFEAASRILARPDVFALNGLHSHIGSQIFDTGGFEMAAHRLVALHARIAGEHGHHCPEIDLGGGYGIAYTSQHTPLPASTLAQEMAGILEREFKSVGDGDLRELPRVSVEPGRAIVGPSTFTLYEVGTVKPVEVGGGHTRTYVSVDGGMSDNARPALYEADYSCTLANRRSQAGPLLSRVVGRHCESGDIVVLDEYLPADVRPGDLIAVPGTGAYCRALSSQYNHTPRPPVVAVRGGRSRVLVRRETIDDLLALDVADA